MSLRLPSFRRFLRSVRGTTAAEFALVLPAFIVLSLGTVHICFLMYAASTLHSAVESAARCASVRSASDCASMADTEAFATDVYNGPGIGATFVAVLDANCGTRVTGTGSYQVSTGLWNGNIPLSATACHP